MEQAIANFFYQFFWMPHCLQFPTGETGAESRTTPIINCENCGQKILRTELKQHLVECKHQNGGEIFKCSDCHKAFKTKHKLTQHIWSVHSEPVKCPFQNCDAVIKKPSLSTHIKMVHERLRDECKNCGKKISYGTLTRHLKSCTSDGSRSFVCTAEGCRATFKTSADRSNHISSVHLYPFSNCGAVINKYYLPKHAKMVHEQLKEECKNCGEKISYGTLTTHLKACTSDGTRPFECTEEGCKATFRTSGYRSSHISQVHSERIKCTFQNCDAVIKKNSLSNHIKMVHERLREECKNCGKKITYGNLTRHMDLCTSDGSRPFQCTKEGCKATFRTSACRSSHISHVHSERIKCPFQESDALIKENSLSNHAKAVHKRLSDECGNCTKKFS